MSKKLFNDFQPVTLQEWQLQILKELNGQSIDILSRKEASLSINPYYNQSENTSIERVAKNYLGWKIKQQLNVADCNTANKKILNALENGVEVLGLNFSIKPDITDLEKLFEGVFLNMIHIHFQAHESSVEDLSKTFLQFANNKNYELNELNGVFVFQNSDTQSNIKKYQEFIQKTNMHLPNFKCIQINSQSYLLENKNIVEEVQLIFNEANNFFIALHQLGISKKEIANNLCFNIAITPNYFLQIAKLRSIRILWKQLLIMHQVDDVPAFIIAEKSWAHNIDSDAHQNILRHTTEAMSAVIAGCDILSLPTKDTSDNLDNDFFDRISTNIQHLLMHESHLDKTLDATEGSYYIENITAQLVKSVEI